MHYNRTKQIFFDWTKWKINFVNHTYNFQKKKVIFFLLESRTQRGGGGVVRWSYVLKTQKLPNLFFEYFPNIKTPGNSILGQPLTCLILQPTLGSDPRVVISGS